MAIRDVILEYLELTARLPLDDAGTTINRLVRLGLDRAISWQVMGLVPIYAGRILIGDMGPSFSNKFDEFDQTGRMISSGHLSEFDIYREIMAHDAVIRAHPAFRQLALSSSEVFAINDLIQGGSKPTDIVVGPVLLTTLA